MDTIELWEQEIANSYKDRTFESLTESMTLLSESIYLDSKLIDSDIVNEGVKEFFVSIGAKIEKWIIAFKKFLKEIKAKIKKFFSKKASETIQADKIEFAKKNEIDSGDIASANTEVKEYVKKSKYGGVLYVNIDGVKQSIQTTKTEFSNIDNWVKSISSKSFEQLSKDYEELESQIKDQLDTDDGKAVGEIIYKYTRVVDFDSTGNNLSDIVKNINKLDTNTSKAVDAFNEYVDLLEEISEKIKVEAIITTFNQKIHQAENSDNENEYKKLLSSYITSTVAFLKNKKLIISALLVILAEDKKIINDIFNIYKKYSKSNKEEQS